MKICRKISENVKRESKNGKKCFQSAKRRYENDKNVLEVKKIF